VTCATVGEAEVMVAAGIHDVLVANEVVEPAKIARLVALARVARVGVAADDPEPVAALSRAAAAGGVTVRVLLDLDIGLHRCGVASAADAVALAAVIERLPGVRLGGIMGYEGRVRLSVEDRDAKIAGAYAALAEARRALLEAGFPVEVVSASGTSTLREALADPTITELQAGVYCLMEPELLVMDLPFRCAATVRGTVVSRHPGRAVLDVGRRAVGLENGPPVPAGFGASRVTVNDEHTILAMDDPVPPLGSRLDLVPGQIRTTSNLHDWIWVTRGGEIVDRWPVAARGRSW
jgi:D-serine deaminase-like pyridoxal phosphate-dependent protein